ncbi:MULTISPECIES: FecCD family ABC transporter permease [unclassified Rathayibacter]|uniref:FecCD family ABC transporter permease n=1 Tax=unclassified Rathayibacter TaxID=2609250 RepID=UPI00188CE937|nr:MULTISPECIES: iron ABC transporter permease [unclassified Rathayibacter]MBF4462597.1 iron ABC transporter permease [Rathayibacter sp. VKM Ac-2879]MBF4503360.1 iron ABC transporter permease [Rathayibacter sp. VKM Ac-2878]
MEPRNAQRFAASAIDVLLPVALAGMVVVLLLSLPDEGGFWRTDRLAVGAVGVVLIAGLILLNATRRRRGQSLGMAAAGLLEAPGYGVRSVAELRRAKVDVGALLTRPRHPWRTVSVLVLIVIGLGLIAIAVGVRNVTLSEVVHALVSPSLATYNDLVIRERVPRAVMAVMAGLALGTAGAVIQGQTRNPLADPDLMGITRGATVAAVLAISLGLTTPAGYTVFALVGALLVTALVIVLAEVVGPTLIGLPLVGAAVSSVLGSATAIVLLLDQTVLQSFRAWMIGGLSDSPLEANVIPLSAVGVGLVMAVLVAPALNALSLGNDVATSLGSDVRRARVGGLLAVGILVGGATAMCGPIAFLGLIAPHTARVLVGSDYRVLLPASALIGAAALLCADVGGRLIARPGEIPAGVVFLVIGAPLFIALARGKSARA